MSKTTQKTSLLKDNSWIRKVDNDEAIDQDPNFGRTVLSHYKSNETLASPENDAIKTTKTVTTSTSVQALSKRFSGGQDEFKSSTLPSSKTSSFIKNTPKTAVTVEPKSSTTTTTVTKNGTTETTITTTETVRSPVSKTPTKTETFSERVKSSSKGPQLSTYSPTRTTKVTETTVTTNKDAEDELYGTLIPSSLKTDFSPSDSKTSISKTETVTVKSSNDTEPQLSTYTPTRTTKVTETIVTSNKDAEDELYGTLIPSSIRKDFSPTDSKTSISKSQTVIVKSSNDTDPAYTTYSPTRTTKVTETTVTSNKDAEDELYSTLIPSSIKSDFSPIDSKTSISKTATVIVKSSNDTDAEDKLYNTLFPKSSKDDVPSSKTTISRTETVTVKNGTNGSSSYTDDFPSSRTTSYTISTNSSNDKTYSYSRPDSSYEYTSITSPTSYNSSLYRSNSRSDDLLSDSLYSRSSIKSVYASPERTVLEKDLCTSCRKPFTGDAKIVLDEMKINCHASCFKCEVCNSTLGHLKAGDSMWIYKRMVHCENCFEITREKWRR